MKWILIPVIGLPAMCAGRCAIAEDEPKQSNPLGFPQYLMLISSPPVQEDIALTDGQRSEIAALAKAYVQSAYEFHSHMLEMLHLADLSPEDRIEVTQDLRNNLATFAYEIDKKALAVLDPSQMRRLAQLRLRVMGAAILMDPQVRERLQLSDVQLKRLTDAFLERNKACKNYVAEVKKKSKVSGHEMKARIDEIRSEAWIGMQRIFTATQKRALRELLGPEPAFKPHELKLRFSLKVR